MALDNEKLLDETGWHLLHELQQNARLSFSELGLRVGLSSPAVAERVRKMEDAGIITGYHAEVDPAKLGFPVMALIRMTSLARSGKYAGASSKQVIALVNQFPEVIESYRASGSDITMMKIIATSVEHLDDVIERLAELGQTTTSIVLSPPPSKRPRQSQRIRLSATPITSEKHTAAEWAGSTQWLSTRSAEDR